MPPRKAPLTHFLCIPLVTTSSRPQLQSAFQQFRSLIATSTDPSDTSATVPTAAVRPIASLHLTLGVMSLQSSQQLEDAVSLLRTLDLPKLLQECSRAAPDGLDGAAGTVAPLAMTLKGLRSMHPPTNTSILYAAPLDADGRLHAFCGRVKEAFAAAHLLLPDTRPLLLHATIVNTIYVPRVRDGDSRGGHGRSRAKRTLNATDILERVADLEWMSDVKVERVAICRMGTRPELDAQGRPTGDRAYVVEAERLLP